jgi:hypothetical protein
VIIELRPDEVPLLAAAEQRHGTKRSAVVAALRAEGRLGDLETALARHDTDHAVLQAQLAKTAKTAATETAKLTKERDAALAAADKTAKATATQNASTKRASQSAAAEIDGLRRALDDHQAQIAELEVRAVDWAFCARCGAWAPRDEWAWAPEEDGEYAYHERCGDHDRGVLDASSRLVWQPT